MSEPVRLAYRIDEAAKIVGLSRATLYRRMKAGLLTTTKVRGRRLIERAELKRLKA